MKPKIGRSPVVVNFPVSANGSALDCANFVADRDYEIAEVSEVHITAGSDGGSVVADVKKASAGTAITGGTSLLASTFNLKSTTNTPVRKNIGNGGLAARPTRFVLAGQQIGIDFTGTMTAYAGGSITIVLVPLKRGDY